LLEGDGAQKICQASAGDDDRWNPKRDQARRRKEDPVGALDDSIRSDIERSSGIGGESKSTRDKAIGGIEDRG
jgi:hypothetical protein